MSLETAIRENTAALQALTAALSTGAARPQSVDKPARVGTPVDPSPTNNTRGKEETPALDYERDVKPSLLRAAAKDKPAVKAILAKFGVERGPAVPVLELPVFLACIEGVLANG